MYPELKGFNPQERAFLQRDTMHTAGSVIHRVTKDIDEGEIVGRKVCDFDVETIDERSDHRVGGKEDEPDCPW